jgi:hypothetical protein
MAMSMTTGMPVNLAPQSAAAAAAAAAAFFSSSAPTNHASSMPLPAGYASAYGGSGVADYAQPAIKKHRVDGTTGTAYGMLPGLTSYPSADAGAGASGELAQIRSLLSMLLEQVRDMKRENSDLREEVLDLRVRLDDNDKEHRRQMDALRREIATVQRRRRHDTSPSSSSSLSSMNNSPTTTTNVLESALQRQAIMTTLPFLREYSEFLDTFILNDVLYTLPSACACVRVCVCVCAWDVESRLTTSSTLAYANLQQNGGVCGVLRGRTQVRRGAERQSTGLRARLAGLLLAHRIHSGAL